jgi:exodeoxyribonuclease VII small subunit
MNFETKINQLQDLVQKMEKGNLTLDESIELYSKAMKIAKNCREQLDNAKLQISENIADDTEIDNILRETEEMPF